jgi:hypothetical protein
MRSVAKRLSPKGALICAMAFAVMAAAAPAQTNPNERSFPQSKTAVEKALSTMESSLAGHLPVLEGFAKPGEHPLDSYQRAYFQSTVRVSSIPSGGSVVRVSTKVTAWYADPSASRSGYQLLISNGRIEADVLDQLADQLAKISGEENTRIAAVATPKATAQPVTKTEPAQTEPAKAEPAISAPAPKFPENSETFPSSVTQGLAAHVNDHPDNNAASVKSDSALQAEADSLEEVLKKQAYPKNLVAVKKSGTPVVSTPSLNAKPEFLASMHDEFELLDFNSDWVHVRVSGLSRGWIWRNSVEMPGGIRDTDAQPTSALTPVADLFHVIREETSTFPGDWDQLKNKNVKIISVQKIDESAKDAGAKARLEYTKFLLEKDYNELAKTPAAAAGIVVIFDSADGGMVAATMSTLKEWRAGVLSDSALWHKCFFDPPETFESSGASGQ